MEQIKVIVEGGLSGVSHEKIHYRGNKGRAICGSAPNSSAGKARAVFGERME